ncbi:hypothetical protein Cri9333_3451 [Crinalium epipsammum PCC 9333]|uniref:Uncharacterized protein n=1 Tax=Crinalium epipsammum PCC 9333 TaxID=1173022 RepID=K9W234_9CYAN|nr:hypothetical protein [Crinalium epipsammum]AFZ14276.1 hypothetical protein Cri9333_3451 [Crinalium epipsammum PCC 9333]
MNILKKTETKLVVEHQQIGRRLAMGCCLLIGAGAILSGAIVPEISCRRNGTLSQCKLIRNMLGNWQLEQPITLQAVRHGSLCDYSRGKRRGACNSSLTIVQTQIGEIQLFYDSSSNSATSEIQKFIKDSNQTSLQIRSGGWSPSHPLSNGFLVMFAIVMVYYACAIFIDERTYTCDFDKARDWVSITQQQLFMCKTTDFPLSSIKSINVCHKPGGHCIILLLQSGQEACIAQASWGKPTIEELLKTTFLMGLFEATTT